MSPPGHTATLADRRLDERRLSADSETLIRDTDRLLLTCGIARSGSWIQRVVKGYLRQAQPMGMPYGPYLLNRIQLNLEQRLRITHDPELANFLCYADPTGEIAVARVLRARRD